MVAMLIYLLGIRKILAPIKIKSAPPPPPKKRGILRTWFFLQKERIFPGVHKIGAAISGPRIADTNFTDTGIFLMERRDHAFDSLFLTLLHPCNFAIAEIDATPHRSP